ncbi:hypothetical protein DU504_17230 [Haloplanus salinus]|uniref:Uncharacterized protein n=1 Tax=Haloplanus salinus TaxID=1126245 RepID=A0A368N1X5_9EURY|nr:hypothetical protein [Haloplanus salinus]RCU44478.1 hypothetical protein DU504_17230 [Haloplanus salinus]
MSPSDEESPNDGGVDLDVIQSDLSDMQSSLADHYALLERGPEIRDEHVIESEVEVVVPPIIADYVRAVVREAAAMTVEERDQFLYEELTEREGAMPPSSRSEQERASRAGIQRPHAAQPRDPVLLHSPVS